MAPSNEDVGLYRSVGKIEGQMREIIHAQNNMSQKIDALAQALAVNSNIPAQIADHDRRICALETDKNKRDGAMGLGGWLFRSPIIGWLATAFVAAWALLKGKVGQ